MLKIARDSQFHSEIPFSDEPYTDEPNGKKSIAYDFIDRIYRSLKMNNPFKEP
jgi:hypothetical protein